MLLALPIFLYKTAEYDVELQDCREYASGCCEGTVWEASSLTKPVSTMVESWWQGEGGGVIKSMGALPFVRDVSPCPNVPAQLNRLLWLTFPRAPYSGEAATAAADLPVRFILLMRRTYLCMYVRWPASILSVEILGA